jgi:tRNA 2-selenouridine synthase
VQAGDVDAVVRELLEKHYDPGYSASLARNFKQYAAARAIRPAGRSAASMSVLAQELLQAS